MGLFSGLEKMGMNNVSKDNLFTGAKKEEAASGKAAAAAAPVQPKKRNEMDYLIDKTHECPVCSTKFKNRGVKAGRVRMIGQDIDLRPKYEQLDQLKYGVLVCPNCGYAAVESFFKGVYDRQKKMIEDSISKPVTYKEPEAEYSYDDALMRYQLAVACSMAKQAKDSEKAYTCLRMAWLLRGKAEGLDQSAADYQEQLKACKEDEKEAITLAYEGFVGALKMEDFPIAGMDQQTLNYLLAALAFQLDKNEIAARFVSAVITSANSSARLKDKARDLKDAIAAKLKGEEE